jgi:hypothetical protein
VPWTEHAVSRLRLGFSWGRGSVPVGSLPIREWRVGGRRHPAGTGPRELQLEIVLWSVTSELEVLVDSPFKSLSTVRRVARLSPLPRRRRLLLPRGPSFSRGLLSRFQIVGRCGGGLCGWCVVGLSALLPFRHDEVCDERRIGSCLALQVVVCEFFGSGARQRGRPCGFRRRRRCSRG